MYTSTTFEVPSYAKSHTWSRIWLRPSTSPACRIRNSRRANSFGESRISLPPRRTRAAIFGSSSTTRIRTFAGYGSGHENEMRGAGAATGASAGQGGEAHADATMRRGAGAATGASAGQGGEAHADATMRKGQPS